jgi:hypothetical protein
MKGTAWTTEQRDYLLRNYLTMSNAEIGLHLGMTAPAVNIKAHRLGLKKNSHIEYPLQSSVENQAQAIPTRPGYPVKERLTIVDGVTTHRLLG